MLPAHVSISFESRLEPATRARLRADALWLDCPVGTVLLAADGTPQGFMTVLEGVLRVQHLSPAGRELMLFRPERLAGCGEGRGGVALLGDKVTEPARRSL